MKIKSFLIITCLLFISIHFSGCDLLSSGSDDPCYYKKDASHCYQKLALERKNATYCEKVLPPAAFRYSNPPRDKCYLQLAEETKTAKYCALMKGGEGSYEKDDCLKSVISDTQDVRDCLYYSEYKKNICLKALSRSVDVEKLDDVQKEIDKKFKEFKSDPDNLKLKEEWEQLKLKKELMYENSDPSIQIEYFKSKREKILNGITDNDVKSTISKEFVSYKKANPDASVDDLLESLNNIKEKQELIKNLDKNANNLIDELKKNAVDYAYDKTKEQVTDFSSSSWKWARSKLRYDMAKLKEVQEKLGKGIEGGEYLKEKYDKFKKVYDEVNEIYNKIDNVNSLVAQGKVDKSRAKVLKGAVYLGKGLEYATNYVPVFGSTVSSITKETFDVTIKLANQRAQRSKSLDDCFTDPANCDTEGITAY